MSEQGLKNELLELGHDDPWSLLESIKKLTHAAGILLHRHSYDGEDHEEILIAKKQAEKYVAEYEAEQIRRAAMYQEGDIENFFGCAPDFMHEHEVFGVTEKVSAQSWIPAATIPKVYGVILVQDRLGNWSNFGFRPGVDEEEFKRREFVAWMPMSKYKQV